MYDFKPDSAFAEHKPKREFYAAEPERGGCLSLYLAVSFIASLLSIPAVFVLIGDTSGLPASDASLINFLVGFVLLVGVAQLASIWGLWNWKRWGYYGLIGLQSIGIVLNAFAANTSSAVGSIIGLAIVVLLMKDKTQYLE